MQPGKPVYLMFATVCVCKVIFNGSYIYAVDGEGTAVFKLADLSIAQNTKQEKTIYSFPSSSPFFCILLLIFL